MSTINSARKSTAVKHVAAFAVSFHAANSYLKISELIKNNSL